MYAESNLLAATFGLCLACLATPAVRADIFGPSTHTLTHEMERMDDLAFVKLVRINPHDPDSEEPAMARFEVIGIVKGDAAVKIAQKLELSYDGEGKIGDSFMVNGSGTPQIEWSVPQLISPRAMNYVRQLTALPKDKPERLQFFLPLLDDEDEFLVRDAFHEFLNADYAKFKALKPNLKHDQILARILKTETPVGRRRLDLKLLGVCGSESDLPLLESYLTSTDRNARKALDAVIASYLTLKGESGVATIEDLFLRNKEADYGSTYSAIAALRFHGNEGGVLKRERVVQAMRLMLKRPDFADLAIPDLADWKDWTVSEEVFELFKSAEAKQSWLRVPAVNYLRRCPTERAKELLAECEKIDPKAVERAKVFFPAGR